ncbi:MAG: methylaspartate ammonia-lyase [Eubacteriales bacterium]|nr:methylaspartate ammonia-lyase [Christensenellaceae bacterium]MDD7092829.1 methylaspartate ammonia-lyase [Christensenellaceae bacterium]MDY3241012.1 methylaspartate ammonia-lyase [Eubacteriales bacterium]
MKIVDVILTKSYTGFYFDDQRAIKAGAGHDGFMYVGEPITEGFTSIRQAGEAISIQLVLEDGTIGYGDCAAVQYSGAGGRDPLFLASDFIPFIEKNLVPQLIGEDVSKFRPLAEKYDRMLIDGKRMHTAIRYGITQALLNATANSRRITMAEVIRDEYNVEKGEYKPVPVFAQSGDDRYDNADKMIIKEADVLPHALINHVGTKLGEHGEILLKYIAWLRDRILKYRVNKDYDPIFHIDVYGTIGLAFNYDVDKMFEYLLECEKTAAPFRIRIEGPIDTGDREGTMNYERILTEKLDKAGSRLQIVADEWCNTLEDIKYFADNHAGHVLQIKTPDLGGVNNVAEAILYCNEKGVGSYCGGTCNETNISAQTTTNIAIACRALQCLAKPGMGVDEGFMIVKNEMNRVIAAANKRYFAANK